jgi:hypothetical protein
VREIIWQKKATGQKWAKKYTVQWGRPDPAQDISASSSVLQGHLRSCLTILDSSRRPLSKNVRLDLVRPQRPELEAEMSVFNLAQKRSFPPLCVGTYVQRGSKYCFVVVLLGTLVRILHFRPISPYFQLLSILCHCMHVTLPGSLARQPCPIVRPILTGFDARAAVQQTGSNLFSCSYVDLLHHN